MENVLLALLITLLSPMFASSVSLTKECEAPAIWKRPSCYHFQTVNQVVDTYEKAAGLCPPDSHPVDVLDEEEMDLYLEMINDRVQKLTGPVGFWTCGYRESSRTLYNWITGVERTPVQHFKWLDAKDMVQRKQRIALFVENNTIGYRDVDSTYRPGLGVICEALLCPPPICTFDKKCTVVVDQHNCEICTECEDKGCNVKLDVEFDGTVCTTCKCKEGCEDVPVCPNGCHLETKAGSCPECKCPDYVVPMDIQLSFSRQITGINQLICKKIFQLLKLNNECNNKVVSNCTSTANIQDTINKKDIYASVVTLDIKTNYINFNFIMNKCKSFLTDNLNKVDRYTTDKVVINSTFTLFGFCAPMISRSNSYCI